LFLSGLIGFGIGDVALFQALPRLGSRLSILIVHCLATPTAALAEYFWLGSRLSGLQIVCIGLSLLGVAIALAPDRRSAARHPQFRIGLLFGLFAMLGQALGAVVSRKANLVVIDEHYNLSGIDMAYQRAWGGILVAGIVYAIYWMRERSRQEGAEVKPPISKTVWMWVLCNTLSGPVLGVSCFQWALATSPTGVVLPIVALTPLVIIPFAHWMEGEKTSWREIWGGTIAVGGVAALARITALYR
jgi:drug/metabolite transporter (DMT)-like permease